RRASSTVTLGVWATSSSGTTSPPCIAARRTTTAPTSANCAGSRRWTSKGSWRRGRDSNPRNSCEFNRFRVCRNRPLCHLSAAGRILSGGSGDFLRAAHVAPQGGGDGDRAVGVLVVLQDCDERSADREARAVQGMHGLGLALLVAEAGL